LVCKKEVAADVRETNNQKAGRVKIITSQPGKDVALAMLEPAEFFGEMALCNSAPRTATAIADADDTRLVVLDQDKFLLLVSQQPAFALTIMHVLCKRIRERWSLYDKLLNGSNEK
jgi:CRP/FNR family cyclic AMP-dependent transcriptional regulator